MCCRVAACCFITDLRRATLLIAILSLVGSVGLLAFMAWCTQQLLQLLLTLPNNAAPGEDVQVAMQFIRAFLAILSVILLFCIAAVILDIVLFFGAFKRRRDMVQCWTYGHAVVSGAYLVYFWTATVARFAVGFNVASFLLLAASILGSVVAVYFLVVVRSYELQLNSANFGTASAGCEPSASTRLRASWETDSPTL